MYTNGIAYLEANKHLDGSRMLECRNVLLKDIVDQVSVMSFEERDRIGDARSVVNWLGVSEEEVRDGGLVG
jgi:hypothetical protein